MTTPLQEAAFKQVLGCGERGGCKPVKEHRLKGDRSGRGAALPMALTAGDRPATLSPGPSRVPPAAPCLCTVSVPALMCHVSSGGFPGTASQSPAKLSLQESGSLLQELCQALPPQPPSLDLWGESGTNWWSPAKPLLVMEKPQPRGQRPAPGLPTWW